MISFEKPFPKWLPIERWSFANQCIVYVLSIMMGFLILYFLFIKPQLELLYSLQSQELHLKQAFECKQQRGGRGVVIAYQKQLHDLEGRSAKLLKLVPVHNEMSSLMAAILKNGASSGVIFEQFALGAQVTQGGYLELPIHITVSGTYYHIVLFLKNLQDMERIVSWHDFDILRKDEDEGVGSPLQMRMELKIYQEARD